MADSEEYQHYTKNCDDLSVSYMNNSPPTADHHLDVQVATTALQQGVAEPAGGVLCYLDETQAPPYISALHNCFNAYLGEVSLQVDRMAIQLHEMQLVMRDLQVQMAALQIKTAQVHNTTCDNGTRHTYHVVPFWDGSCPILNHVRHLPYALYELRAEYPKRLPRINNLEDVRMLSENEVITYCRGYGINMNVVPRPQWRGQLAKFVGSREPFSKVQ
ncbi:hypothetical protein AAF712_009089 [Marasmius tenuissimus]|uniref:Mug135-like C-terminal domain-containing protein n=1 Tax=Marasmius tenuissimus TaxID=585030 RepID=A0ABR2ZSF3_9AGAR